MVRISRLSRLVPTTNLGLTVCPPSGLRSSSLEQFVEFVLGMGKMMSTKPSYWGWEHRPVLSVFISTVSLKADKNYDYLYICGIRKDKFVSSMVRRVERLTESYSQQHHKSALSSMPLRIWYDALTGLAELHRAYPQNHKINDDWASVCSPLAWKSWLQSPLFRAVPLRLVLSN